MTYIQSTDHLRNYLVKAMRDGGVDPEQLLPLEQYVTSTSDCMDAFAWAVRQNATILHEEKFWDWLRHRKQPSFPAHPEIDHITTPEFIDTLAELTERPGIYSFWNTAGTCLYVGVSINLGSRIASSFTERFKHYFNTVYLRYHVAATASDAAVLEVLAIAKLKPVLNTTSKFEDICTLPFELPRLSAPVACNRPGPKVSVRVSGYHYETRLQIDHSELEQAPDSRVARCDEVVS